MRSSLFQTTRVRTSPARIGPPLALVVLLTLASLPDGAGAQSVRGVVTDETTGGPVGLSGVYLLDDERQVLNSALADSLGRYLIEVPDTGSYYLLVQRLGYFETESPLVRVAGTGTYGVDFTIRPEPIRLDGILVEVPLERQNSWASDRLRYMQGRDFNSLADANPAAAFGFRLITGMRLEEAKLKSDDALEMLRWVYVPIYNTLGGMCMIGRMGRSDRTGWNLHPSPFEETERAPDDSGWNCGRVYLDGIPLPAEHVESIPHENIHAVMLLGSGELHLITVGFEARFMAEHGGR